MPATVKRCRWCWGGVAVLAGLLLGPWAALANVSIQLDLNHDRLLPLEPVVAFVTIRNDSGKVMALDGGGGASSARLECIVERGMNDPADRIGDRPLVESTRLQPGAPRSLMLDVGRHYDLSRRGSYAISVALLWNGVRYRSNTKRIDVVNGLPLSEATMHHPVTGELRRYRLSYLRRDGTERLFLDVDDREGGKHFGVHELGPLVRVYKPVLEVAPNGWVTVVHQAGTRTFVKSVLDSNADTIWFIDQQYYDENEAMPKGPTDGQAGADEDDGKKKKRSWFNWLRREPKGGAAVTP